MIGRCDPAGAGEAVIAGRDRSGERESLGPALDRVYRLLADGSGEPGSAGTGEPGSAGTVAGEPGWHPFEHLGAGFGLTEFERDLLVMCAGFTLEGRFSKRAGVRLPTFGLALTVLPDPHWSAITPSGPLRHWQLVEVGAGSLLDAPLTLDERVLQFILGVPAIDGRLAALVRPLRAPGGAYAPERAEAVAVGIRHWRRLLLPSEPILLIGRHRSTRRRAFARICRELALQPYTLDAADIPADPAERERLSRLWTREAMLGAGALLLATEDCERVTQVAAWLAVVEAPMAIEVVPGTQAERLEGLRLELAPLTRAERLELWRAGLGPVAAELGEELERIAEYYVFDEPAIELAAAAMLELAAAGVLELAAASEPAANGAAPVANGALAELCWRVCREHGRRSLGPLAQRIEAHAGWEDLVLPDAQVETLRQIALHVRRRVIVNEQWGFAAKHSRGLGLTALFAGASGTGKTMAAEVLAAELGLDLYRVDLASVVSKYIGETEKNLRAVFDGAEESGAVLLFDEADALFGKRSEVRDSHDRYANLEISYLLQRMEAYRGVAILTTNMEHAIDSAFMRRIRFVIHFPVPDHHARARIWRRIFPAATPLGELDWQRLAQLSVPGGAIRNIAMHAAFLAADNGGVVRPVHIVAAARTEYAKLERPLTPAELRGLE